MKDSKNMILFFLVLALVVAISWRSFDDGRKEVKEEYADQLQIAEYWSKAEKDLEKIADRLEDYSNSSDTDTLQYALTSTYDDIMSLLAFAP